MKRRITTAIILLPLLTTLSTAAHSFPEKWGYLMKGEEKYFPVNSPITDIACFSAAIDGNGILKGGHETPPTLPGTNPGTRYHLVITLPWNPTLAHIYLDPELPFHDRIIAGIVERAKSFDGVQIDFESIDARDGTAYLNFLAAARKALPAGKCFSVAVLARWKEHKQKHPNDAFDYPFIGMIADRVIVMAYDEHYRSGSAGPVASLPWCTKIYDYARKTINPDKLVMGIPLYGRSWQTPSFARAYKNPEIIAELRDRNLKFSNTTEKGGYYHFTETVAVDVHFETVQSLQAKLSLYSQYPIRGVAFWRFGQEPQGFWKTITNTGEKR